MLVKTRIQSALAPLLLVAGIGATGCTASVTAEPVTPVHARVLFSYPVVHVESAPPRVYERPHTVYRGRNAYLVDNRWYYPSERGWVYFREEPRELRRYRETQADARPARRRVESPREERRRRYYD
ncbi:MAG: hypothetical protein RL033_833 [Pseudomonadota bacterium]|jgi:hypothetical protein